TSLPAAWKALRPPARSGWKGRQRFSIDRPLSHSLVGSNLDVSLSRSASGRLALLRIGSEHACKLPGGRLQNARNAGRRRLNHADDLCAQLIERRERGERLNPLGVQVGPPHGAAEQNELFVRLGEFGGDLRSGDW